MNVLVTGVSGYIGGQTALMLKDQHHTVFGVDRIDLPEHLKNTCDKFYSIDFENIGQLNLVNKYNIDAIVHCAGTSLVGPSVKTPGVYYENNFVKTKRLLDYLTTSGVKATKLIFSSSAAVYGEPTLVPCSEEDLCVPVSPYGQSKMMIEMMINAYASAYGLQSVTFRYFNACGADHQGRHGQAPGATHIIARLLESVRDGTEFVLNGDSFPTPDGTCVRDYVHVEDIVSAHVQALELGWQGTYNLGTAKGFSNRQVIDVVESVTGKQVNVVVDPPRTGDPAELTADASRLQKLAGWSPRYDLDQIIEHAWQWYNR